ncbi:MAG: ImmA/IrrE family metallo-endopeptidase [Clostridia bacterium]|nr:ImmA/IrrE family metallo-endopeptidase [Clostridia bacterium]
MREYIVSEAHRLREKYKTDDPFLICEALGVDVRERADFKNLKGFYCVMNRRRFIVINANLNERDKRAVCAHELGHDRLHRELAASSVMRDFSLYDTSSKPEYQANLFAAELLISDSDVLSLADGGMDYFSMCRTLSYAPDLVAFKLYSMIQRGYALTLPQNVNSRFWGK